jgi:hypothetical protein
MMTGQDYAGTVRAERGRWFRFVYDIFGKPDRCSAPVTHTGWFYLAHKRKWYSVDSCERLVDQLEGRPKATKPGSARLSR